MRRHRSTHSIRSTLTALAVAAVTLLGACGGGTGDEPTLAEQAAPATAAPATSFLVARTGTDGLTVFDAPDGAPVDTLAGRTEFGSRTVLLVEEHAGEWLHVQLPVRPNGATGWVRTGDVELREIDAELRVDLDGRTLELRRGGTVVLTTPIAIGTPEAPTPTGHFYVTDLLDNPDDDGAYGPFALGLSAHSDVLTEFAGGDGQVGIHGTNDASSIGNAASHGCVRVPNDVIARLANELPLGTPVTIA